jgi:uncharacterized protein (TIGR01244 family)
VLNFLKPKGNNVNIRKIDDDFAITGQITPEQVKAVAEAGYKGIVCARPDGEEAGQPSFEAIAHAANSAGLAIVHVPVAGPLSEGQIIRFQTAWDTLPKPILGYCRSGARAGSLYQTLRR